MNIKLQGILFSMANDICSESIKSVEGYRRIAISV